MTEAERLTKEANERTRLRKEYLGKQIRIINMVDEPQYTGKTGIVQRVDDIGQLHGTWGGCSIVPDIDDFEVVEQR